MSGIQTVKSPMMDNLPINWTWSKMKFVATIKGRIGFRGYTSNDIVNEGEGAIALSPSNIEHGKLKLDKLTYISWEKYYESPEIIVESNQIILCKTGSSYGKSALVENVVMPLTLNPQLVVIKPNAILPGYLAFLMESSFMKDQIEMIVGGGTMPTINQDKLLALKIIIPTSEDQKNIANYLKKKCEEIDYLISLKLKQIRLLQQQREVIITNAVTKGLNPNVQMKDSGVKWIGEIPNHWKVTLLKRYLKKLTDGSHFSPEIVDEGYPYITVRDLKKGKIDTENALKISEFDYNTLIKNGCRPEIDDILMSKDGTIGKVAIVKNNNFVVLSSLALIRPNEKLISNYLAYWLESSVNKNQMESYLAGAALRRLTLQSINKLIVVVPSLRDQRELVDNLNKLLAPLDEILVKINAQIEKLKEYRQSLINEAVTGKIKVRENPLCEVSCNGSGYI